LNRLVSLVFRLLLLTDGQLTSSLFA
jgi:hypothetical protein